MRILKHYLISHKKNGYTPKLLAHVGTAVLLFLIVGSFGTAVLLHSLAGKGGAMASVYSSALEDMANSDRGTSSLPALTVNPLLEKAAQEKADDMLAKGYFAHYSPDGSAPWHWISKVGYQYVYAGENLAIDFSDSSAVEQAWLNSPTHRANIMNPHYTEMGVAIASGNYEGRQTTFVVEVFASPLPVPVPVASASEPKPKAAPAPVAKVESVATATRAANPGVLAAEIAPKAVEKVVTNPKKTLIYIYAGIGALIILALLSIFVAGIKKHNILHLFYGGGLISLMLFLLTAMNLMFGYVAVL